MASKLIENMAGTTFGRLVVVELAASKNRKARWMCRCDCGCSVIVTGASLREGDTRSCGCLQRDISRRQSTTHGMSKTPEYRAWIDMIARCTNRDHADWADYGGRGITVCVRWRRSFSGFLADMKRRPMRKSLDRINNDGNYEPGNCRWSTAYEQVHNRRK